MELYVGEQSGVMLNPSSNSFPHNTFNWVGLDGTQVLAHMTPVNNYNSQWVSKTDQTNPPGATLTTFVAV